MRCPVIAKPTQLNTDTELIKRDGKVALRQIGTYQRPVPISVGEVVYSASIQNNIWLAWVDENDVDFLLTKRIKTCDCGGGAYKPLYKIASALDVSIWTTGDRPH